MSSQVQLVTGDAYKDEVQNQWNEDPCGSHYVTAAAPDTVEWFLEAERYRYGVYAPWMRKLMEFDRHRGEVVLEIGAGMGTDLAQFANAGAEVHDLDLASGHLHLAQRNFELRGLNGNFHHGDAENMPFEDGTFDLVYSNGVIHHTPNTARVISEINRVLKPGGRCIVMVYAEYSLHYWRNLFAAIGVKQGMLRHQSMGAIMSESVELSEHGARPLVKVYTARRLRRMFGQFTGIRIYKRQMIREELPSGLRRFPLDLAGRLAGWNLIVKAHKPVARSGHRSRSVAAAPGVTDSRKAADLEHALAAAQRNFVEWFEVRRSAPRQYTETAAPYIATLREREPTAIAKTIAAADEFIAHRFDLLGSGPFVAEDPDRPATHGYQPIDWYLDPVRNLRFPRGIPHKEWKLYEMRPTNADIKYPWELARCQHWITLAQAWRLVADSRFAIEIAHELDDFMEANPPGIGVNWTCTMDVAIRAANWCLALALLLDCQALNIEFWERAYTGLFDHASFIFNNLENTYEVTSNHYLSNVVGLHMLAAEFGDLAIGQEWNRWCRDALETEIKTQVHAEGADFESSVPYHRLVTELFLASARLARLQEAPLSVFFEARLGRMVEFLLDVARPDGGMPVIGDADDGRLHIFSHFGEWDRQDARHLLAPAGCLLGRPDWLAHAGDAATWEAAWWGFAPDAAAGSDSRPPPDNAKLFPEFGVAVARRGGNYLAVTNGKVGTRGFGNHKHNELLGFEYHYDGRPVIVDTGSFGYTGDFAARNLFRGTAYHNTLEVDGVEQNEINPEWIFRMFEKANPEHLLFAEEGDLVRYHGRHHGYKRLDHPVTHERHFSFDRATGLLVIEDRLSGAGEHALRWHFHLAPDVSAEPGAEAVHLAAGGQRMLLLSDCRLHCALEASWYSPSYGVRVPALCVALHAKVDLSEDMVCRFAIGPEEEVRSWHAKQRDINATAERLSA